MRSDRRQPSSKPNAPQPAPRLLNLRQAATYLGVGYWSVRDWALTGTLPTVKLPSLQAREGERQRAGFRRVLVDREDLDRLIAERKSSA